MTAGRPKSDKPKSHITSIRVTEDDRILIITMYGTVQNFIDHAIINGVKKLRKTKKETLK